MTLFKDYRPRHRGTHRARGRRAARHAPGSATTPAGQGASWSAADPRTAFTLLYEHQAGPLLRQSELLSGDHAIARRAVAHAFRLAWESWPSVATDQDPAGWVRSACHEYALAPWQRLLPGRWRAPVEPAAGERPLRAALLALPPGYRRALLLADGLGLRRSAVAAECEATTAATAARLRHARAALADRLPPAGPGHPSPADQLRRALGLAPLPEPAPEPGPDAAFLPEPEPAPEAAPEPGPVAGTAPGPAHAPTAAAATGGPPTGAAALVPAVVARPPLPAGPRRRALTARAPLVAIEPRRSPAHAGRPDPAEAGLLALAGPAPGPASHGEGAPAPVPAPVSAAEALAASERTTRRIVRASAALFAGTTLTLAGSGLLAALQ
ncbi:hypothetical protein RM844_03000 [Streptomyces sp. DSM 44915]|uniref:RNA polymerase sigma factor 70 region 4 type 2 domain-containing protein n=1 Tax=Streptomyces chisholmiae TaxID=3075540 RepID=A0ABU2JKM6_9ACTN|nr:hypothetical protein [Streptomyces sp. DSM 44915]MDT0265254.1 hypothetical protein [Streptomyces sp. DSM 44915]